MTPLIIIMLVAHIVLSLIAVMLSYATWMELARRRCSISYLRRTSVAAGALYFLAWLSGGYYYVVYYGATVKPVILAGAYPWAHTFFLEVKEHIFLFLPFMALATAVLFWTTNEQNEFDEKLRKPLITLVAMTTIIGILIALAGIATSGAVR